MSDKLEVWELRVEHIVSGRVRDCFLFFNIKDAKKHAEEYVKAPVPWTYPEEGVAHNYAVGCFDTPHLAFFLRLREIR